MKGLKKKLKQEKVSLIVRIFIILTMQFVNPISYGCHINCRKSKVQLIYINLLNHERYDKITHYNGDKLSNTINHEMLHHVLTKYIDYKTSSAFDKFLFKATKDYQFREWTSEYGLL
jgi:hypothetical protein